MNTKRLWSGCAVLALCLCSTVASAQNFENRTTETGLGTSGAKDGGLAWGDFNNDGCLDVLVNTDNNTQDSRLYQSNCGVNADPNDTTIRFTDRTTTLAPGLLDNNLERSAVWADFNEDGYLDFVRNTSSRLEIYLNKGPTPPAADSINSPFSFGTANGRANIVYTSWTINGTFNTEGIGALDYDLDGHVDLLVDNHNRGIVLLRGDGNGNFTQVPYANTLLPATNTGAGDYSAVGDIDVDGDIDFLGRKGGPDLWLNDAANTTHTNGPQFSANAFNQAESNSNKGGVALCDFDNDGDFDFFWTENSTNQIWRNDNNTFVALNSGTTGINIPNSRTIDSVTCADVDNDGDLDIFLTDTGNDRLYINNGGMSFTLNNLNITGSGNGEGAAFGDYDNDGDLDLLINQSDNNQLWANQTNNNQYVMLAPVILNANGSKRPAVGATVKIYNDAGVLIGVRELSGGHGHGTSGTGRIHIGVPDANARYTMEINFPSAGKGVLCNVIPANITGYNLIEVDASLPDACPVTLNTPADNTLTNDNTPRLAGTTDSGNAVVATIRDTNGNVVQTRTDNTTTSGNWAVNATTLPDGTYTVTVETQDDAGNDSTDGPHTFTVDATSPRVNIDQPIDGTVTSDNTPTISGTAEPGAVLRLTIRDANGSVVGMPLAPTNNNGNWTIDAAALPDGPYTVTIEASDAAGNDSTDGPDTFIVDTTAPTIALNTPANNTVTNDNTPRIAGTTDSGNPVTITIRDTNGNVVQTRTDNTTTSGNWAVNATTLPDGTYTVTVETQDDAGNDSTDGPHTFTVDTTAPTIALNTPANNTVTNDNTPTISGTTDSGNTVTITVTDSNNATQTFTATPNGAGAWTIDTTALADDVYIVTATTNDDAGNTATDQSTFTVDTTAPALSINQPTNGTVTNDNTPTITGESEANAAVTVLIKDDNGVTIQTIPVVADGNGDWSVNANALPEGPYTVEAAAMDANGNMATAGPNTFTIDTTAPAVTIATPANNSTSNDTTPTLSGTTEPNAMVELVLKDSNGVTVQTLNVQADNTGQYTVDATALADGDYTVEATATDVAGNMATAGPNVFNIDTTAPALSLDTPVNNTITNDNTPTISGTAEPNAVVVVNLKDDNGTELGPLVVTADNTGAWSIDTNALPDGPYTVDASSTDAAGNVTTDGTNVFTVDTVDPTVTLDTPADQTITNDDTPTISGTAEPGSTLLVTIRDANGNSVGMPLMPTNTNGTWNIDAPMLLEGTYTVVVEAKDDAGNTVTDGPHTFSIDLTDPTITITAPADGATISNVRPTFDGSTEASATVTLTLEDAMGNTVHTATVQADGQNGSWSVADLMSDLVDGDYTITATTTDLAGNSATTTSDFTVDTSALPIDITAPIAGSATSDTQPSINGSTAPGESVTVELLDPQGMVVETLTVTADAQGNWVTQPTMMLADGDYVVNATVTNPAGTTTTDNTNFTVDTTAPTLTLDTPVDQSALNDNTPTIAGTTDPGATVTLTIKDDNGNIVETLTTTANPMGNYTIDASALADGDYTVDAEVNDAAGNTKAAGPNGFSIDTTAPNVDITAPQDNTTLATRDVQVDGTSDANQDVVVELLDGNGVSQGTQTVTTDANGNWSTTFANLPNDTYSVTADVVDDAGNTAQDSTSFTVDSTEALISITQPTTGSATTNPQPDITGLADPDATVVVLIKDPAGMVIATLTPVVDPQTGMWTIQPDMPLADGDYTVEATATRPNGTTATATATFEVDTTTPVITIDQPAAGTTTPDQTPELSGTTEPGAEVVVTVKDDQGMVLFEDTIIADDMGNWSTTPQMMLPEGDHTIDAMSTDKAGNTATVGPQDFTIDTSAPVVTITAPTDQEELTDPTPTITGTAAPGATVKIFIDGEEVGEATADDMGNWSFDVPDDQALDDGPHTIEAKTTNPDVTSSPITVTVKKSGSSVTITSPKDGTVVTEPTVTIEGEGTPGEEITVTVGGETQTVTVKDDGTWEATFDNLPEGQSTVTAKSGDDEVTIDIDVQLDNTAYILLGNGCSSTGGQPTDMLWFVFGALCFGWRRRRRRA